MPSGLTAQGKAVTSGFGIPGPASAWILVNIYRLLCHLRADTIAQFFKMQGVRDANFTKGHELGWGHPGGGAKLSK